MKLRGELSQGMILAGEDENGLSLATIDQNLANGTKINNKYKKRDVSRVTCEVFFPFILHGIGIVIRSYFRYTLFNIKGVNSMNNNLQEAI